MYISKKQCCTYTWKIETFIKDDDYDDRGADAGEIDVSKWKKFDAKTLGVKWSMISEPSWIVLKILRRGGDVLL